MSKSIVESNHYFIIYNISKKANIISLIHSALAFHFVPILVGSVRLLQSSEFLKHFDCQQLLIMNHISEVISFLSNRSIPIISIELAENAKSVNEDPFTQSIAFMAGNEGNGLSEKQYLISDGFIYIPQYGKGIESLNVSVASSIVLYKYFQWFQNISYHVK
jgi:tRNA G18 (ribose-2'-O)-methylase SpoU